MFSCCLWFDAHYTVFVLWFFLITFSVGSKNISSAEVSLVTGSMLVLLCPTKPGTVAIAAFAGLLLSN